MCSLRLLSLSTCQFLIFKLALTLLALLLLVGSKVCNRGPCPCWFGTIIAGTTVWARCGGTSASPYGSNPFVFPLAGECVTHTFRYQPLVATANVFVSILGLGSGRAPYEDHMCGDHDGTKLVAQKSTGTGWLSRKLYVILSSYNKCCSCITTWTCHAQTWPN